MEPLEIHDPVARDLVANVVWSYIQEVKPRRMLDLEPDSEWRVENLAKRCKVNNIIAPNFSASDTLSFLARDQGYKGYFDFILAVGVFEQIWDAEEAFGRLKYLLDESSGRLIIVYRDYDAMMAMYGPRAAETYRHPEHTSIRLSGGIPSEYVSARKPEIMRSLARKAGFEILSHESIGIPHRIADKDAKYRKGDIYFHLMALRIG